MNKKSRLSRRLRNAFPDWSDTFLDDQSNGAQLFGIFGNMFDNLYKEVQDAFPNFFLHTTRPEDLGLSYKAQLPQSFTFQMKDSNDDQDLEFETPTVSGLSGSTYYAVTECEDNDIRNFWRNAIPTRISLTETISNPYYSIISNTANNSPFIPAVTGTVAIPNNIYVRISGMTECIGVRYEDKYPYQGIIQIHGKDQYGMEVTEELYPIQNEELTSLYQYSFISGVSTWNLNTASETYVNVMSHRFQDGPYKDNYRLDHGDFSKETIDLYWGIVSGTTYSKLTAYQPTFQNTIDRIQGFSDMDELDAAQMSSISGEVFHAVDIAIQPGTDFIWAVSNQRIYQFDKNNWPSFTPPKKITEDPAVKVVTSSDVVFSDETVDIQAYWKIPTKGIKYYELYIYNEAGTKYSISSGSLIPYSQTLTYGEPINRVLLSYNNVSFITEGLYTIVAETTFVDNTVEYDKRIVYAHPKLNASKQFDFSDLNITNPIVGVDIDYQNKLWVIDSQNNQYNINFHYDNMIIDYEEKTIYLRENYSKIIVDYPEEG